MKKFLAATVCAATIALAGCGDSKASDFEKAFVEKYEKPACLNTSFPYRPLGTPMRWATILEEEGLLAKMQKDNSLRGTVYTVTAKGLKQMHDDKLCYGKVKFVKVVGQSEEREQPGVGMTAEAEALFDVEITEDWGKHPEMQRFIETGEHTKKALFVKKEDGWVMAGSGPGR